jgi:sphinganine-1-phosphate aldolase
MSNKLRLPNQGYPEGRLLAEMEKRKESDADWYHGRSWSLVYYSGEEHDACR